MVAGGVEDEIGDCALGTLRSPDRPYLTNTKRLIDALSLLTEIQPSGGSMSRRFDAGAGGGEVAKTMHAKTIGPAGR